MGHARPAPGRAGRCRSRQVRGSMPRRASSGHRRTRSHPGGLRAKRGEIAVVAGFQGVHASRPGASLRWGAAAPTPARWRSRRRWACRALRHLHRRRWRLYDRPAGRAASAQAARARGVRGDARDGLARRESAAGPLRRGRPWCMACPPTCARPSTIRPNTRSPGTLICAEEDIMEQPSRHRHRLFARRSTDHAAWRRRPAGYRRRDLHARSLTPTSTST